MEADETTGAESYFRDLLDGGYDLVSSHGPDGLFRWASGGFRPLGWDPDELVGQPFEDLMHPDDRADVNRIVAAAEAERAGRVLLRFRLLVPARGPDAVLFAESTVRFIRDDQGELLELHGFCRDVTEQVVSDRALVESEERYRLLAVNANDLVVRTMADGLITYVSPSVTAILGYVGRDLIDTPVIDLVHPDDRDGAVAAITGLIARPGTPLPPFRCRTVRADGRVLWTETMSRAIYDRNGAVVEIQSSTRDVDAQVESEQELRRSEQRFRAALASSPSAIALVDRDHRVVMANAAAADLVGIDEFELVGCDWRTWVHPNDRSLAPEVPEPAGDAAEPLTLRFRSERAATRWGRLTLTALPDHGSSLVQIQDITEERRRAELLEHRSRHDAVTGLPNRTAALDQLERLLPGADDGRAPVTVFAIRIDALDELGDVLGHTATDEVIAALAARLVADGHPSDMVARLESDRLAVICPHLASDGEIEAPPMRWPNASAPPSTSVVGRSGSASASAWPRAATGTWRRTCCRPAGWHRRRCW